MKKKDKYYVLQTDDGKLYMTMNYGFTEDIRRAAKCANKTTVSFLKDAYYYECKIKNIDMKDLKTVLVNLTYEWEE